MTSQDEYAKLLIKSMDLQRALDAVWVKADKLDQEILKTAREAQAFKAEHPEVGE